MATSFTFPQCSSAVNVASFVSVKLRYDENNRNNYKTWRKQMLCLVESQGLVGFIEGTPPKNPDDAWRRTDWLVKGWILGALSDEVIENVVDSYSASRVWLMLENEFSESGRAAHLPPLPPPPPPSTAVADQGKERHVYLDLYRAVMRGEKDTAKQFLDQGYLPDYSLAGDGGLKLLVLMIDADFFDMALDLVDKYPDLLSKMKPEFIGKVLKKIALTAFSADNQLSFWKRSRYWSPGVNRYEEKLMREQSLELVKYLCKHIKSLDDKDASAIFADTMLTASQSGNHDVVEEIVGAFPRAIHSMNSSNQTFLHLAVKNRCEKVFNLMYQSSNYRYDCSDKIDNFGNSILHMAAHLAPPHKLNLVSGAALKMQREIQWFQEARKFVAPYIRGLANYRGETAEMIFTLQHRELKIEGEKWMKDTAKSCTIAAALIATVVFAAAITVPGGNQLESGYPLFSKSIAFKIFAVSDAVSLFTSTTSLLMFLSILTRRYAEHDFLYALPKRLCFGLVTLFVSILFMVIAFSSIVYLVFGQKNAWVLIAVVALASVPVSSFVLLQHRLLRDVISSTYCRSIFGKQSDRPFP